MSHKKCCCGTGTTPPGGCEGGGPCSPGPCSIGGCGGSCPSSYLLDVSGVTGMIAGHFDRSFDGQAAFIDEFGGMVADFSDFTWGDNGPTVVLTCSSGDGVYTAPVGTGPTYPDSGHDYCGPLVTGAIENWVVDPAATGPGVGSAIAAGSLGRYLDPGSGFVAESGGFTGVADPVFGGWYAASMQRWIESATLDYVQAQAVGGCFYIQQRLSLTLGFRALGRVTGTVNNLIPPGGLQPAADCVCFGATLLFEFTRPLQCFNDSAECYEVGDMGVDACGDNLPDEVAGGEARVITAGASIGINAGARLVCPGTLQSGSVSETIGVGGLVSIT